MVCPWSRAPGLPAPCCTVDENGMFVLQSHNAFGDVCQSSEHTCTTTGLAPCLNFPVHCNGLLGGLEQQNVLSHSSGVTSPKSTTLDSSRGVNRLHSFWRSWGEPVSWPFPVFWGLLASIGSYIAPASASPGTSAPHADPPASLFCL